MARRICLVESVIMSSLVHSMMSYRWPGSLLKDIDKVMRNFIWSGNIHKRGSIHVAWSHCCAPKIEWGLGLRSVVIMNEAYLFLLAWDIISSSSLGFNLLRSRFLDSNSMPRQQYIRSSIFTIIFFFF